MSSCFTKVYLLQVMQNMTLAEVHVKQLLILMHHLSPSISWHNEPKDKFFTVGERRWKFQVGH